MQLIRRTPRTDRTFIRTRRNHAAIFLFLLYFSSTAFVFRPDFSFFFPDFTLRLRPSSRGSIALTGVARTKQSVMNTIEGGPLAVDLHRIYQKRHYTCKSLMVYAW